MSLVAPEPAACFVAARNERNYALREFGPAIGAGLCLLWQWSSLRSSRVSQSNLSSDEKAQAEARRRSLVRLGLAQATFTSRLEIT